jgi:predicted signal transduction protein with EAL and GGDEF domain
VGDELLVRVAARITKDLREADTAARFGGDEFAVLLHQVTEPSVVELIVNRLQEDLGRPYDLDGHEVVVTASIGIATGNNDYERAEDVLRDADIAMYRAKSAGRAGHATFDSSMYAGAITRLQTETALRQAIEQGQLELHYQPIVDLADGTMQAMEVLVRWRHPLRGLISPAEFLTVAEESGLIVPMGRWVELEACRQLCRWKVEGLIAAELRASINLSNREFWNPGLLEQVDHVLSTTGVPAEWLVFEITEGVIMHNLERALEVLGELHARGIQIHIDDFGTGYSSLEALHRLPIDALKIDRSFVANLQDDKSTELVRTIVQLGRNLGVDVIAEGIETPSQQHVLAELGCPLGQGFWFSVPVPAGRLGELMTITKALPLPADGAVRAEHRRTATVPGRARGARRSNGRKHDGAVVIHHP